MAKRRDKRIAVSKFVAIAFWPACATIAAAQSPGGANGGATAVVPGAASAATPGSSGTATAAIAPEPAAKAPAALVAPSVAGNPKTSPSSRRATVDYKSFSAERMLGARLVNAERIHVRIPGHANISGEYRVNGDGTIALPGLGRFEISTATIADFETQLADEIARISGRETAVTIEVLDYRPVFVSGSVARAGAFPWKPGLSILHAETLAGGMARGDTATPGAGAGVGMMTDREKDRALRAAYELAATLATIARLRVEKENGDKLVVLAKLSDLVSPSDQAGLIATQEATLRSRNSAHAARISAITNARTLASKELGALLEQRVRMLDQLSKRRATLKKIENLASQGFARADRVFEDQLRISELEERLTNTTLAIARIEATAATAQVDLDVLKLGRIAEIDTEILRLEQKASQLELELDSANGAFRRITGQELAGTRATRGPMTSYEIVRTEAGVSKVIKADRATLLQPGDVLMVNLGGSS